MDSDVELTFSSVKSTMIPEGYTGLTISGILEDGRTCAITYPTRVLNGIIAACGAATHAISQVAGLIPILPVISPPRPKRQSDAIEFEVEFGRTGILHFQMDLAQARTFHASLSQCLAQTDTSGPPPIRAN